ncbi:MAG TPA: TIM-barrel domain-containing protein [Anaerolineales bacterium]|nr:TIM-barrel domain-containing protein [Anaerolineales bacterium]
MKLTRASHHVLIEARQYTARLETESTPGLLITREGRNMLRLPLAAGLGTPEAEEGLSEVRLDSCEPAGDEVIIKASAASDLWSNRAFRWTLSEEGIEFQHFASGKGALGRCHFFSDRALSGWGDPTDPGAEHHATIYPREVFTPRVNHANTFYQDATMPQSLGVRNEMANIVFFEMSIMGAYLPEQMARLFCPPPLWLAFGSGSAWAGVGLGERPGQYRFNALDFSGARSGGATFHVNYNGYRQLDGDFASPVLAIHFGFSPFEALERYIGWIDRQGFGTQRPYPNAAWQREPVFCGWAEQTVLSKTTGVTAAEACTQANYEKWLAAVEARGIPFGTVVIDDKWMREYGTLEIDAAKWPDLPGFIAAQHAKGRHVVLWIPGHHAEGIDEAWCVKVDEMLAGADAGNPDYEAFLRKQIRRLIVDVGADGFKEDWIAGLTTEPGAQMANPAIYGIEALRRWQWIVYDEAHKHKPDAFIESQTPNPLFRESSDVLRLNDLFPGTRDVPEVMRTRARIARLAGWELVDTDNASSTTLQEWWDYAQVQPQLGIPALYFVDRTESTLESPSEAQWHFLADLWKQYRKDWGLDR